MRPRTYQSSDSATPRLVARVGVDREACGLGGYLMVDTYDGAVIEAEVRLLTAWLRVRVRLFYSGAMAQRSMDRWQADALAGEYPGITLTITPSSDAA